MYWIGFDVGGTFIDLYCYDTEAGDFFTLKVPSSRERLPHAISAGIERLLTANGIDVDRVGRVVHGTTIVANQLVEGRGARVGVITTSGFRDVLEIGRMRRPSLYDLYRDKVPPLAPRDLRLEVRERVTADGTVRTPLDEAEAERAIDGLRQSGAEVIAVCFLNSYANPNHEERLGELCKRAGMAFTLSSKVSAEYGEFERWTTAVVNSHVMPKTAGYLGELGAVTGRLGIHPPVEVMQSNGGVIAAEIGAAFPVRLVESGPAAGVTGATLLAYEAGFQNVITMDMGGTSTDVSLVLEGRPSHGSEYFVNGFPLRVVGIDIRSIGAGGGSLALLDRMGALTVGPESAGSEPGPACYGTGGIEPTVTDADLVLGYLNPLRFCGGDTTLDVDAAREAIGKRVAEPSRVRLHDAALGIVNVAAVNMAGAVRKIATERGYDPRDFALVAYGGAGPVHAGMVAQELEIPEVLVPNQPGLLSAKGLLLSDYRTDVYRSLVALVADVDPASLERSFQQLEDEGTAQLAGARDQVAKFRFTRILEMSYAGQQYVIPVEVGEGPIRREQLHASIVELNRRFKQIHGFVPQQGTPQVLRIRVSAEGVVRRRTPRDLPPAQTAPEATGSRDAYFGRGRSILHTSPVYDRDGLPAGSRVQGPAIIEEAYSTTVVYPGQIARIDPVGNIRITAGGAVATEIAAS